MATEKADTIIMLSTSFAWIEPCLSICMSGGQGRYEEGIKLAGYVLTTASTVQHTREMERGRDQIMKTQKRKKN